jgi:hypothetical protein
MDKKLNLFEEIIVGAVPPLQEAIDLAGDAASSELEARSTAADICRRLDEAKRIVQGAVGELN